ncbi:rRNA-processing protein cgr1 [Grosmannia clavigera kw1407]|uniref:rRNA-processing protein n=1 Tax=Grosmannia clavigera (strain kw1407 / UAMH 11150) TaxID=655863 RepID=F0XIH7_GROCL|nr:rRNA-processing protein cgr1 [Grosmannia clavigera kw1407]EFX02474.1 rRNA-processing protein cgr1 [Grosmannia clavigera kw1407]
MSSEEAVSAVASAPKSLGLRRNGKQWHEPKKAFRPASGLTSFAQRSKERIARATMKAKEKELKDEKEAERQVRIKAIRDKKAAKEEKERYEKLAEKMHKKRVERLKRKEKRNKLLHT